MTRRKYDDQGDENSSGFGYNKENYRHDDKKETVPRLKFEQRGVQTELSLRTCTEVRNSGSFCFKAKPPKEICFQKDEHNYVHL